MSEEIEEALSQADRMRNYEGMAPTSKVLAKALRECQRGKGKYLKLYDDGKFLLGKALGERDEARVKLSSQVAIIERMFEFMRIYTPTCNDKAHDERWCSRCESMKDGVAEVEAKCTALDSSSKKKK